MSMSNKRQQKSKEFGKGSQLDRMRRIRKEMPPATKVEKSKSKLKRDTNWRDLIDDEDNDNYEEWE